MVSEFMRHIVEESALLRSHAVGNLGVPVPSCGEWDMRALVEHVATVFVERSACIHAGSDRAAFEEVEPTLRLSSEDPIESFDTALADILNDLRSHEDSDPAVTWVGLDNTVGFWRRRLAHEVMTHRVDAELALGLEVSPIDSALAADGVNEFIDTKLIHKSVARNAAIRDQLGSLEGVAVKFVYGDSERSVTVAADGITEAPAGTEPHLTFSADPMRLNLWLWRRLDFDAIDISGSAELAAEFYRLSEFIGQ
ncbi:maleylpyruvate isomerase family mycothiol-dependent enzyme [Kitasatospora sp. NPDC058162]|uniref:maleylpyruvate isomerase family mycothiol-dependent enzyme n=1 Tax=Kitasatospora sp. NPDC058162 TaxID=3346362 RepID=UPI0036DEF77D